MLAKSDIKIPSQDHVKTLTLIDLAIMNRLSVSLKKQIRKYIDIDPFTTSDPFQENDDYDYSVILDKTNTARVISILAANKESPLILPWDLVLDNALIFTPISKAEAATLKHELMPKDTNNFYPYRQSTKITGYIMFAFQICGLHQ